MYAEGNEITTMEKSKRIDEEAVCIDSIMDFLGRKYSCEDIQFQIEPQDPPDFWITVAGRKYAAEVTSIVTDEGYHAHCNKLREEVRKTCTEKNCIMGKYVLIVKRRPAIPKRNSEEWRNLISNITALIGSTSGDQTLEETCLYNDSQGKLVIEKNIEELQVGNNAHTLVLIEDESVSVNFLLGG